MNLCTPFNIDIFVKIYAFAILIYFSNLDLVLVKYPLQFVQQLIYMSTSIVPCHTWKIIVMHNIVSYNYDDTLDTLQQLLIIS